jgi:hypothetical protein
MLYTSFSLNGSWIMDYTEENYASRELPVSFPHLRTNRDLWMMPFPDIGRI